MAKGVKGSTKKHSYDYVKKCFEDRGFTLLEHEYINAKTPMRFICKCGNESKLAFGNLLIGQKCKECGYKNRKERRFTFDEVYKFFESENCRLLEKEYKNGSEYMLFKCYCGNIDRVQYYHFKKGRRCKPCGISKVSGENHHNWNPNLTDEERLDRRDIRDAKNWSFNVKQRDQFTCQKCSDDRGRNLVSHHIEAYSTRKELRFELSNGITLCKECHKDFHAKFGYGGNTAEQFDEWVMTGGDVS